MSMGAALGLMSKLSTAAKSGEPSFSSALQSSSGAGGNTYALKIDSGSKKDWLVVKASDDPENPNPEVLDPNYPDSKDIHNKGFFKTVELLKAECPTADTDDYAFVIDAKWIWDNSLSTPSWRDSGYRIPTPISFNSEDEANSYKNSHDLEYIYENHIISTISSFTLVEFTSASAAGVSDMADNPDCGLAQPCTNKYIEKMAMVPPVPPTPADYLTAIKEKMMSFL